MPTETNDNRRNALRLGLGTGLLFVLSTVLGWPLGYLAAVFTTLFLQAPTPPPARQSLSLASIALLIMLLSYWVFSFVIHYPVIFFAALFLALGLSFTAAARGASPLLVVMALLGALLVPFLILNLPHLALDTSLWIVANLAIALLATWVAFTLYPPVAQKFTRRPPAQQFDITRNTLRMCLVALPFAALFFLVKGGNALTLIFIALLAQQLSAATDSSKKVAAGMLIANIAGGFCAVIAYELVVMAPEVAVMALAALITTLGLATWRYSDHNLAPIAGSALTAFLVLFGGAMGVFGDDADAKMLDRVFQIGIALAYTLGAFVLVDRLLPLAPERQLKVRKILN